MSQTLAPGSLAGKIALVTGSSRGIGADTVRFLAEAGADVVINYRNKAPRAEKLAGQLRERGVRVLVVGADLTDPASVQAMFAEVEREFAGSTSSSSTPPAGWRPEWRRTTRCA
jgi:NAD(P)-dependent dehydrogenase (short-subunit alcohol dehydrogenase family)